MNFNYELMEKHDLDLIDALVLTVLDTKRGNAESVFKTYEKAFGSKRTVQRRLDSLEDKNLVKKISETTLYSSYVYYKVMINDITTSNIVTPSFSEDIHTRLTNIIEKWNSIPSCSSHKINPYGEQQTKTINLIAERLNSLSQGSKVSWSNTPDVEYRITDEDICTVIDEYAEMITKGLVPKPQIVKGFHNFLRNYDNTFSKFFDIYDNGPKESNVMDKFNKEHDITSVLLKKAYRIFFGKENPSEVEKYEVQSQIRQLYMTWEARSAVLNNVYDGYKPYSTNYCKFHIFLNSYLTFFNENKIKAKVGYMTMGAENSIYDKFRAYYKDKTLIMLKPNLTEINRIRRMQGKSILDRRDAVKLMQKK